MYAAFRGSGDCVGSLLVYVICIEEASDVGGQGFVGDVLEVLKQKRRGNLHGAVRLLQRVSDLAPHFLQPPLRELHGTK